MALENRNAANMNNFCYLYMQELGMSDPAKQEFMYRAETATGLENFESLRIWEIFTQPRQVLEQMVAMGPFEMAEPESIRSVSESVNNNLVAVEPTEIEMGQKPLLPDLNELPASAEDEEAPADYQQQIMQVGPVVEAEGSAAGKCRISGCQGGSSWVKRIKAVANRVFKKVSPANKQKHKAVMKSA